MGVSTPSFISACTLRMPYVSTISLLSASTTMTTTFVGRSGGRRPVPAATPGLGTRLGPDDGERDRRGGDDGEQAGTVLSHHDSLPARRRCRGP